MLRKLIKHEFRATARLMLPLFALSPVTALGGNLSVRFLLESDSKLLYIIGIILLSAFVIAMAAVFIMAVGMMVHRFYKNLLQDEGYVMLTLPVSVHQHIWSKLIVSTVWFALSCVVVALSIFILVYDMGMMREIFAGLEGLWAEFMAMAEIKEYLVHGIFIALELVIMLLAGALSSCLHFYMALALGHSFSRNKMLFSVLFYFIFNFIMQFVNGLVAAIAGNTGLAESLFSRFLDLPGLASVHPVLIAFILYNALYGIVSYFITAHCLSRRLNLE